MAGAFSYNPNYGSVTKKFDEYTLNRHNTTRTYSVFSGTDAVQRPLCCYNCIQVSYSKTSVSWLKAMRYAINGGSLKCKAERHGVMVVDEKDMGGRVLHESGTELVIVGKNAVEATTSEEKEEDVSRAVLIWRAIKLPMYSVIFVPLIVGTAAAYLQTGQFFLGRSFNLLAFSSLVLTWCHLSNDAYDYDTGADKNKKESFINLFGGRMVIGVVSWLLLALGFMGFSWVAVEAGSLYGLLLYACKIFCLYIYQCPPFRLSYLGLGEPLMFASFGPSATIAFYLLQSSTRELPVTGTIVSASVLVGLTTALILFCSHFHQIKGDKAVGKISPLVRLGTDTGAKVVKAAVLGIYSLVFALGIAHILPVSCAILCALTIPMGNIAVTFVEKNHKDKTKIFMGKYFMVRLHTLFGAALAAGLVAARVLVQKQLI